MTRGSRVSVRLENAIGIFLNNQFIVNKRFRRFFSIIAVFLMVAVATNVLFQNNYATAQRGWPIDNETSRNDWIIEDGDDIEFSDITLTLNGNLTIESGGVLTLSNVDLFINVSFVNITIEEKGAFYLNNCYVFSDNETPYGIVAKGKIVLVDCEVYNTYTLEGQDATNEIGGIILYSSDSVIVNTEIHNPSDEEYYYDELTGIGITVIESSPVIVNNSIHNLKTGISYQNASGYDDPLEQFSDYSKVKSIIITDGDSDDISICLPANSIVTNASLEVVGLRRWSMQTDEGENSNDMFGRSISGARDFNNDSFNEIIVGVPGYDGEGKVNNGKIIIYKGSESGTDFDSPYVEIYGESSYVSLGYAVSDAGDINGDGYPEIIVSAPYNHTNNGGLKYYAGKVLIYTIYEDGTYSLFKAIEGEYAYQYLGWSLSDIGDFNNDGFDDFIIGSPYNRSNAMTRSGRVDFYLGDDDPTEISEPIITIEGSESYERIGNSIDGGCDIDSDGISDAIIGSDNFGKSYKSKVFVYYGSTNSTYEYDLLSGSIDGDGFGVSVALAGDLNGDEYDDIVIGIPGNDTGEYKAGAIRIYNGSSSGLNEENNITIYGDFLWDKLGYCVASGGDVNSDGYNDVVSTAIGSDVGGPVYGKVSAYFGSSNGINTTEHATVIGETSFTQFGDGLSLVDVDNDGYSNVLIGAYKNNSYRGKVFLLHVDLFGMPELPILEFNGSQGDKLYRGFGIGDHDGDGFDDYIISNYEEGNGKVDLYYGNDDDSKDFITQLEGNNNGAHFGFFSAYGDINGDGKDDFAISAPKNNNDEGMVKVGLSGTSNWIDNQIFPSATSDLFGYYLGIGDFNKDSYDDLVISAPQGTVAGQIYVYNGSSSPSFTSPMIILRENQNDWFGNSLSVGDIDNDGFDDLVVSANNSNFNNGKIFLYHGSTTGLSSTPSETLNGSDSENLGTNVSVVGDLNSDGYDDIVVGASKNGTSDEGKVSIYFGDDNNVFDQVDWTYTGSQDSEFLGEIISQGGDLNGDGFADFLIGSPNFYVESESSSKSKTSFRSLISKSEENPEGKVIICYGSENTIEEVDSFSDYTDGDRMGNFCQIIGDHNNDGYSDVLIGEPGNDTNGTDAGIVGIYYSSYPYYPELDIGADGKLEWSSEGRFNGSYVFQGSTFINALNNLIPQKPEEEVTIPIRVTSTVSCKYCIRNLQIEYQESIPAEAVDNIINDCKFGIIIRSSKVSIYENSINNCIYGIYAKDTYEEAYSNNKNEVIDEDLSYIFTEPGYDKTLSYSIPKGVQISDVEIELEGVLDKQPGTLEQDYEIFCHNKSEKLLTLNTTEYRNIPEYKSNQFQVLNTTISILDLEGKTNGTNPDDINLTATFHPQISGIDVSKKFNFTDMARFYDYELTDESSLQFNVSVNQSGVSGNFTFQEDLRFNSSLIWQDQEFGYNATLIVTPPNETVFDPEIRIFTPNNVYSTVIIYINGFTNKNSWSISENGYIRINPVEQFGDSWDKNDETLVIDIELRYYPDGPSIDINNDGVFEWQTFGEFTDLMTISSERFAYAIQETIDSSQDSYEIEELNFNLSLNSRGKVTLTKFIIRYRSKGITNNTISNNYYGIYFSNSSMSVVRNDIQINQYGIFREELNDKCSNIDRFYKSPSTKELVFENGGVQKEYLCLPSYIRLKDARMTISGEKYLPDYNNGIYITQGNVITENDDFVVPDSFSIQRPTNFKPSNIGISILNVTLNGAEANPSDVDLAIEHNGINLSIPDGYMSIEFIEQELSKSQNPLIFNVTVNDSNVEINITSKLLCKKETAIAWNNVNYELNETINIQAPDVSLINPYLIIYFPNQGFAEYNLSTSDLEEDYTDYCFVDNDNLILGLNNTNEIDDVWDISDTNFTLNTRFIYYFSNPRLQIGDNIIWETEDDFETTEQINSTLLQMSINEYLTTLEDFSDKFIPFDFYSSSAGILTIEILDINFSSIPSISHNNILNNFYGIYLTNNDDIMIENNFFYQNDYGIYNNNSMRNDVTISEFFNGSTSSTILLEGNEDSSSIVQLPNWIKIEEVSFDVEAKEYPFELDLETSGSYFYEGLIRKEFTYLGLNKTINVTLPENYLPDGALIEVISTRLDSNLTSPSVINLTIEHAKHNYTIEDLSPHLSLFNLRSSSDIIRFNITSNQTNVDIDLILEIKVRKEIDIDWIKTDSKLNYTIEAPPPTCPLINPKLGLFVEDNAFAKIEANETIHNYSISENAIDTGSKDNGLTYIDLSYIGDIGRIWDSNDNITEINVSFIYEMDYLELDIGNDGSSDWTYEGDLEWTSKVVLSNFFNILSAPGHTYLPFTISGNSYSEIKINNLSINGKVVPKICSNYFIDNDYGVYENKSESINQWNYYTQNNNSIYVNNNNNENNWILENSIFDNKYGIYCYNSNVSFECNYLHNNSYSVFANNSKGNIVDNIFEADEHSIFCFDSQLFINQNQFDDYNYGIECYSEFHSLENILCDNILRNGTVGISIHNGISKLNGNRIENNSIGLELNNSDSNISFSIFNENEITISCNSSDPTISNSTIDASVLEDFTLYNDSNPMVIDSFFDQNRIEIEDTSDIICKRNVNLWVKNITNEGIEYATMVISNSSGELFNKTTDQSGRSLYHLVDIFYQNYTYTDTNYIYNFSANKTTYGLTNIRNVSVPIGTGTYEYTIYISIDSDNDGLNDAEELFIYFTNASSNDTDQDGLFDGLELGLVEPHTNTTDLLEFIADTDPETTTDPNNDDSDGDSALDGEEDEDNDGRKDGNETDPNIIDSDSDGIPDGVELYWNEDTDDDGAINALDTDSDGDGLLDSTEDANRNGIIDEGEPSPANNDTNKDGVLDNNMTKMIQIFIVNVTGIENYSIEVHGLRLPENSSLFFNETDTLNLLASTGYIQQDIKVIILNSTDAWVGLFLLSVNGTEGIFNLTYSNITVAFNVSYFNFEVNQSTDTDEDGLNDLLEIIYMSGNSINCTSDDIDDDGLSAIEDNDTDDDGLTDLFELNKTFAPSVHIDSRIYRINYEDEFYYKAKGQNFDIYFKNVSNDGPNVIFERYGYQLMFEPTDVTSGGAWPVSTNQNVSGYVSESTMKYDGIFENTNLTYRVGLMGMSKTYNMSELPSMVFNDLYIECKISYDVSNLSIYVDNALYTSDFTTDKSVEFRDNNGNTIFILTRPYVYDSNGSYELCEYDVSFNVDSILVNVVVPYAFLTSNSVEYPIYIDPTVSGSISGEWNKEDGVYYLSGTCTIESGTTLIINDGVTVEFESGNLNNRGSLLAFGKEDSKINFIHSSDYNWIISYFEADTVFFDYCNFYHMGLSLYQAYFQQTSSVTIQNSIFEFHEYTDYGIQFDGEGSGWTIRNCDIKGNIDNTIGLYIDHAYSDVLIEGCTFSEFYQAIDYSGTIDAEVTISYCEFYDNNVAIGERTEWSGMDFNIKDCAIYDNEYGIMLGHEWGLVDGDLVIEDCSIYDNTYQGINFQNVDGELTVSITNNLIKNNQKGIEFSDLTSTYMTSGQVFIDISNNNIYGNLQADLEANNYVDNTYKINAENNYWGAGQVYSLDPYLEYPSEYPYVSELPIPSEPSFHGVNEIYDPEGLDSESWRGKSGSEGIINAFNALAEEIIQPKDVLLDFTRVDDKITLSWYDRNIGQEAIYYLFVSNYPIEYPTILDFGGYYRHIFWVGSNDDSLIEVDYNIRSNDETLYFKVFTEIIANDKTVRSDGSNEVIVELRSMWRPEALGVANGEQYYNLQYQKDPSTSPLVTLETTHQKTQNGKTIHSAWTESRDVWPVQDQFRGDIKNYNYLDIGIHSFFCWAFYWEEATETTPGYWVISYPYEVIVAVLDEQSYNNRKDSDYDGLTDGEENYIYFTNPLDEDTDSDGLTDYEEVHGKELQKTRNLQRFTDRYIYCKYLLVKEDGVWEHQENNWEKKNPFTDPKKKDTDNDGLTDLFELEQNEAIRVTDEERTEIIEGYSKGIDNEELKDRWYTDLNPIDFDSDDDGIGDGQEYCGGSDGTCDPTLQEEYDIQSMNRWYITNEYGSPTSPFHPDTDGDGLSDGLELSTDINHIIEFYPIPHTSISYSFLESVYPFIIGGNTFVDDLDTETSSNPSEKCTKKGIHANDGGMLPDGWIDNWDFNQEDYLEVEGWLQIRIDSNNANPGEYQDLNGNGRLDNWESDPSKIDSDGDGVSDWREVAIKQTNPANKDTDNDGLLDKFDNIKDWDMDRDSLIRPSETLHGLISPHFLLNEEDSFDLIWMKDPYVNKWRVNFNPYNSEPKQYLDISNDNDIDNDGKETTGGDLDKDNDGMSDQYEQDYGTSGSGAGGWQHYLVYNTKYAILFAGKEDAMQNDCREAYDLLLDYPEESFKEEDIYFHCWDIRNPNEYDWLDEDDRIIRTKSTHASLSKESIFATLDDIGNKISKNDFLFILTRSHGPGPSRILEEGCYFIPTAEEEGGKSVKIKFNDEEEIFFGKDVDIINDPDGVPTPGLFNLPNKRMLFTIEACFCGMQESIGFLAGEDRIVVTSDHGTTSTFVKGQNGYGVFAHGWEDEGGYTPGFIPSLVTEDNEPNNVFNAFVYGTICAESPDDLDFRSYPLIEDNNKNDNIFTTDYQGKEVTYEFYGTKYWDIGKTYLIDDEIYVSNEGWLAKNTYL